MNPSANSQGSRLRGNLRVGVLACLAVLLTGLLLYWASGSGEAERRGAEGSELVGSAGPGDADSEGKATESSSEKTQAFSPAGLNRTTPSGKRDSRPGRTILRITGIVADIVDGQLLEGALVQWIPLGMNQVWPFGHDAALSDGNAGRIPEGLVRDALLQSRTTRSSAEGRYVLEIDQPRQGVVVASKPGYETSLRSVRAGQQRAESASGSLPETRLNFLLRFGGSISGSVIDGATGLAARGMAVAVLSRDSGIPSRLLRYGVRTPAALVDSEGRYSVQGIPAGSYLVAPKAAGSLYASVAFKSGKEVTLEAGSDLANVDFEVHQGGRITGRALSASGEAVPGVHCRAMPSNLTALSMSGESGILEILNQGMHQTGLDGRFEFRGLPLDRSYRIKGFSPEVAEALSDLVRLTAESPQAEIDLVMNVGSRILGQVVYTDGRVPAAGTFVIARAVQSRAEPPTSNEARSARTDSQGGFDVGPLNAAQYRLTAAVRTGPSNRGGPPVIVEVDGRSDVAGIVITVQEPDGDEISGVAVDDLGRPLEGAVIQASSPDSPFNSTTSRSDGSFVLETKGEGPLEVTAEKVNHSRGLLSGLEAGSRNIRLVLKRYGQVSGRVVTLKGGRLPQGGRVELLSGPEEGGVAPFRMPFGPSAFVKPGEDGAFRFDSKAGQVELVARFEGFAPLRSGAVTVRPGEETGGIELVLASGSRLLGSVLFKDGRPVEGAQVVASSAGTAGIPAGFYDERAVTDRRGRFEMPHLEAGQYSLSSNYPGYAPSKAVRILLEENQQRDVTLEITRGGSVSGRLLEDGVPKSGLLILMESGSFGEGIVYSPSRTAVTDDEGRFLIEELTPGDYALRVQQVNLPGRQLRKQVVVTIRDNATQHIEIDLARGQ